MATTHHRARRIARIVGHLPVLVAVVAGAGAHGNRDALLARPSALGGPMLSTHRQQSVVVDAGSFTIVRGAARVGREEFTIRQAPPPDGSYLANATVVYADRRLTPALTTDSSGAPQRYQVESRGGDRRDEVLSLQIARGHGNQRIRNARGESATEFVVAGTARLLDDDVFDQYYFVARTAMAGRGPGRSPTIAIPVVMPHRSSEAQTRVTVVGDDTVGVSGHVLTAIHLHMAPSTGDDRDIWVDPNGRVLRVSIPGQSIVATRDDVPR